MPYLPGKTPVICNCSDITIEISLPGVKLHLSPFGNKNLDVFVDMPKHTGYINKILTSLEIANEIKFCSVEEIPACNREVVIYSSKEFDARVDSLLREEKLVSDKKLIQKPIFTPRSRSYPVRKNKTDMINNDDVASEER